MYVCIVRPIIQMKLALLSYSDGRNKAFKNSTSEIWNCIQKSHIFLLLHSNDLLWIVLWMSSGCTTFVMLPFTCVSFVASRHGYGQFVVQIALLFFTLNLLVIRLMIPHIHRIIMHCKIWWITIRTQRNDSLSLESLLEIFGNTSF